MTQEYPVSKKKTRKTDRRTLYTRQVITEAYLRLLKEKPRDSIKVAEICRIAEINRTTFYLHFEDIRDVEKSIAEDLKERLDRFVSSQQKESLTRQAFSDRFMETLLHDSAFVTLMTVNRSDDMLSGLLDDYFESMQASLPAGHGLSEREQELMYLFISGGVRAVQQDWIRHPEHISEENHFLDALVRRVMKPGK